VNGAWRFLIRAGAIIFGLVAAVYLFHVLVVHFSALEAPKIQTPSSELRSVGPALRYYGASYVSEADGIIEARLEGTPAQVGFASGKLLRQEILETEGRLFKQFEHYVPRGWARALLLDWARIRYSHLDRNLDASSRDELAGLGAALEPDPFSSFMPAYQRLVYLSGLYDISLSFERAPLVGCTTFLVRGKSSDNGHSWLARNFDFEVDEIFDQKKVLYLMVESGTISFASVAWPGIPGVVSGMNAEGLALVVHGGRAGNFDVTGEPVLQTMRYVLGHARSAADALEILRQKRPMVSHIVIVTDPTAQSMVIERVPRQTPYVYRVQDRAVITNHFIGPATDDPQNERVREETTTLYRQQRGQQILARYKRPLMASDFVDLLRERRGINDVELPLGDRRAIGALIAAHGVVFDTTDRKLWVSTPPHLLGRFIEFDLKNLLGPAADPNAALAKRHYLSPDPLYVGGQYDEWKKTQPNSAHR
jgi:hypothetical protein